MNFPQGDHDFCLETFERRLRLEKSGLDYTLETAAITGDAVTVEVVKED